jgi:hypothetical protein
VLLDPGGGFRSETAVRLCVITAVAASQSQRFYVYVYSGVGIWNLNWHYLSSPPQIPRAPGDPLERQGLTYVRMIYVKYVSPPNSSCTSGARGI